jgi:membrane protein
MIVPYLLTVAALAFIYSFIPNTKVRIQSAIVGALVSGVMWKGAGWVFKTFVLTSVKYTAIYSAFATLIMFMIWMYLGWLILLVGASIAFYHQKPEYLQTGRGDLQVSNRVKEKLAILIAELIGANYYKGHKPWTLDGLASRLRTPVDATLMVLSALEKRGLLTRTGDDPPAYIPGKPLETTTVKDALDAVRSANESPQLNPDQLPTTAGAEDVFANMDGALNDALAGTTLKQLALGKDAGD